MAGLEKFLDIETTTNTRKKFVVVKNFLNENDQKLFYAYAKIIHQRNKNLFDGDKESLAETLIGGDIFFDCLLENKRKILEEISGKKLLPLISIMKVYINESTQKPFKVDQHRQLTCQINLGSDVKWKTKVDTDDEFVLENGDALVYCGNMYQCQKIGPLNGDHYINLDLQYCENTPNNLKFMFDQRKGLGEPACS